MKKIMLALFTCGAVTFAYASGMGVNGNGDTNGVRNKPCYVDGQMQSTLMDFHQCKALGGVQDRKH